jgi:uncharacterized protein YndB with AHSA1/START domain
MGTLEHKLDRTVVIEAAPETVFRYFTDSTRWARWWGAGSTIDARPGGKMEIRYPEGTVAQGEVLDVKPPERIVFTYGYASGKPIGPGSSRVTIELQAEDAGTRLQLTHEFDEAAVRDEHVQGWRYQLAVFGNAVADEIYADASSVVDGWFAAWAVADETARQELFSKISAPDVRFRDRFSLLAGLTDLVAHSGAAQRFMPGVVMTRQGDIRRCQSTVLADWVATGADGRELMSGTNVFTLQPDGRIREATGFAVMAGR